MSMFLTASAEPGFLRVVVTGSFSLDEAQRSFLEILDLVEQHGVGKVLVDGREITGEPTTIQRFYYGEFAAKATADYRRRSAAAEAPQFAYVLQEPVLDPQRFGETVAVNRGMRVKAFDKLEDALRWLTVGPAHESAAGDDASREG